MPKRWYYYDFFLQPTIWYLGPLVAAASNFIISALKLKRCPTTLCLAQDPNFWAQDGPHEG